MPKLGGRYINRIRETAVCMQPYKDLAKKHSARKQEFVSILRAIVLLPLSLRLARMSRNLWSIHRPDPRSRCLPAALQGLEKSC